MRNLLSPKWLFLVNTLPIAVLLFLLSGQFQIIKTLLDDESVHLWKSFGFLLALLGALNFVYAVFLVFKKQDIAPWYGVLALLCYIPYLYLYGYHLNDILPASIPQWMVSGDMFLYAGTFLMPTLAYSLFILVAHLTPSTKEHKAWVNFLIAISIPMAGYLFTQIILPLWKPFELGYNVHVLLLLVIAATLVFLFFLVRGVFILTTSKAAAWRPYQLAWKIPIAILLPLLGLAVNNGHLLHAFRGGNGGIFGDFGNDWFYILAFLNGILVCLPNTTKPSHRLILFILRSVTFAYTCYFFLVFLPFLPLSVIAIIAFGTGFLMITPLLLFVIHSRELSRDFAFLKAFFPKKRLAGISILAFLLIPVFITAKNLAHKKVLHQTLAYLYSPDYAKPCTIDKTALEKTIDFIKHHKDQNGNVLFSSQIPYLSAYYNWLVLGHLTLSDTKIKTIEKIFFGTYSRPQQPETIRNEHVKVTHLTTRSSYDKMQNAWKSWVDLELTNQSSNAGFAEFATTINLPAGCWVSDYYLYVGNKKEPGILAEKQSAMWVFSQIRNENRDPGILHYLTGNKIAFRVFPFAKNEVRKTGIEFLHKEPIPLTIEGKTVVLGKKEKTQNEIIETENLVYVPAQQKQLLKTTQRKPYFHFLVDVSLNKKRHASDFIKRIEQAAENNKALLENAKISLVNTYVNTIPFETDWKQRYQAQTDAGGFYLDRAVRTALFQAYKSRSYPVIVVVTDSIANAVLDKDFSDLQAVSPEIPFFFNLNEKGILLPHSLTEQPAQQLPDSTTYSFDQPVLEYRLSNGTVAYIRDDNEPSIIVKNDKFEISEAAIGEKNWLSALAIQGLWTSLSLHPENADKQKSALIKYSFMSKVMTPLTAYLVVENEAQKAMLKKKQEQALSGHKSLDIGEDTERMHEPSLWILALALGVFFWMKGKRKRQVT